MWNMRCSKTTWGTFASGQSEPQLWLLWYRWFISADRLSGSTTETHWSVYLPKCVCVCVCSSVCLSGYLTECLGIWPACRASKDISSLQSDTSKRYTVEEKVVHSSVQRLLWASYEGDQVLVFQHFSSCFSRGFNYSLFYSSGQFFRLGHFLVKKYFWNVSWSLFPCCAHSYGINQIKPWLKRNL